jgi:PAT family beta-lactamase induction signal transducer AmpG
MSPVSQSAYRDRRVWVVGALGLFAGLPLYLSGATLSAWLSHDGVTVDKIGAFALVGLPYSLKFLWAPLIDRFPLPLLGRRRGWLVVVQILVAAALALLSMIRPAQAPLALGIGALACAFFAATLDIVIDAYRADLLPESLRAAGAATYVGGYRTGMLIASAGALMLADRIAWPEVYRALAVFMVLGALVTLVAPEPPEPRDAPPATLAGAAWQPLAHFFARPDAWRTLAFVMLFKMGDTFVLNLINPFLLERGYSQTEVGAVGNGVGLLCAVGGAFLGSTMVTRLGQWRALILFGALQALANSGYLALALTPKNDLLLAIAIAIDHLCTGLATSAFVPYLMSLTDPRYSATQYALLTSAAGLCGRLLASTAGLLVAAAGWPTLFAVSTLIALPGVLLARRGRKGTVLSN